MSFYLSTTRSIFYRKVPRVFYFRGTSVYMLFEKQESYLFDVPTVMEDTPIKKIIEYIDLHNIKVAEILLPHFDDILIDLTFDCIAKYLLKKDVSIGLLVKDKTFIPRNQFMLDRYGISYSVNSSFYFNEPITKNRKNSDNACYDTIMPYEGSLYDTRKADKTPQLKDNRVVKNHVKFKVDTTGLDMDKPFVDILMALLIKSGRNNVDVYTKAGITRQVFSKILCNKDAIPSKDTVICLIIGLELDYSIAEQFLSSAGYALSRSIVSDAVIMKYLKRNIFDLRIINDELDRRQCPLLGWKPRDN